MLVNVISVSFKLVNVLSFGFMSVSAVSVNIALVTYFSFDFMSYHRDISSLFNLKDSTMDTVQSRNQNKEFPIWTKLPIGVSYLLPEITNSS